MGLADRFNLVLIAGVFIAAGAMRSRALTWWPQFPGGEDGVKAALWLGAMLLSLPLLIAVFRKTPRAGHAALGDQRHARRWR